MIVDTLPVPRWSWEDGESMLVRRFDGGLVGWPGHWHWPSCDDPARMCEDEHGSAVDVSSRQQVWQSVGWWDAGPGVS